MAWLKARDPEEPHIPWWLAGIIIGLSLTLAVAAVTPFGMSNEFAYTVGLLVSLVAPQVAKNNPVFKPVLVDPFNLGEVRVLSLLGISPVTVPMAPSILLLLSAWLLPDRIGEQVQTKVPFKVTEQGAAKN
ncbi:MAG: hypothetical protein ACUVTP_11200 [Candidatus Fervidibacter sp.]|uniref:hypothetical protein n=1 Tax=Candidatus Fervidibacter sp. TaxID=3100871 RepID=UPI0040498D58